MEIGIAGFGQPAACVPNRCCHGLLLHAAIRRSIQLVKAHARIGRIQLQVERRCFGGFLLITCELGEAGGGGVGDAEVHTLRENLAALAINIAHSFRLAFCDLESFSTTGQPMMLA